MRVSEIFVVLMLAGGGTTVSVLPRRNLWPSPRHTMPAVAVGMAVAVMACLLCELAFGATGTYARVAWIVPLLAGMAGVQAWRAFESWCDRDMTVAGLLGFDQQAAAPRPPQSGGRHFGVRAPMPRFGMKRRRHP